MGKTMASVAKSTDLLAADLRAMAASGRLIGMEPFVALEAADRLEKLYYGVIPGDKLAARYQAIVPRITNMRRALRQLQRAYALAAAHRDELIHKKFQLLDENQKLRDRLAERRR